MNVGMIVPHATEIKSQLLAAKLVKQLNNAKYMAAFLTGSCIFHQATQAQIHAHPPVQVEQTTSTVTMRASWLQQHGMSHLQL